VTPSESSVIKKVAYEPLFLAHLRDAQGVRGIRRVVMHEPLTNLRPVIFLQFADGTQRSEVWRGLNGAAFFQAGCGKVVIAVSEDVDPANLDAVLWSIAYRSNPIDDVQLQAHRGGVQGAQYGERRAESTMMIDATRKRPMPPVALPAREFMERARQIWDELGLPPVKTPSPWHGYTLGEWGDDWARFAERAVAGEWEANGLETLRRQRPGLEAETPVRKVEM
jgi:hypothetical protein